MRQCEQALPELPADDVAAAVAHSTSLHAALGRAGARVAGAPVSPPWGLREFTAHDPAGTRLGFGQPFE